MLFRAIHKKTKIRSAPVSAVHGAVANLPMKVGDAHIVDGFAKPFKAQLLATGMGDLVGYQFREGRTEEPSGIELHMTLASPHPRALKSLGQMLEVMDAPVGSTIEFTETGQRHMFGRTEGLAVDLDPRSNWLDYAEAAIETLAGTATYHGSRRLGQMRRLYFYGENASNMASQLLAASQLDARLPRGRAQRLS